MNDLSVVQEKSPFHIMGDDNKPLCSHNDINFIRACCTSANRSSSGYIECGCNGTDEVVCESPDCTGLTDEDIEEINNDCWG